MDDEIVYDSYDLDRFLEAQELDYTLAYKEMEEGRKQSHWIWYIFPQLRGLGHSYNSIYYGLEGKEEAGAYLAHPILGERLRKICRVLLTHDDEDIYRIMGSEIDVIKLRSCMELFDSISPGDVFEEVINTFFNE